MLFWFSRNYTVATSDGAWEPACGGSWIAAASQTVADKAVTPLQGKRIRASRSLYIYLDLVPSTPFGVKGNQSSPSGSVKSFDLGVCSVNSYVLWIILEYAIFGRFKNFFAERKWVFTVISSQMKNGNLCFLQNFDLKNLCAYWGILRASWCKFNLYSFAGMWTQSEQTRIQPQFYQIQNYLWRFQQCPRDSNQGNSELPIQ